ncbi:helix-turn-helix domain-containing protein [Herbaspirillum lusitanum]|uniref:helix-turn-helix domain-containing protein n=1 Tax=Herbaspirillum lusitanum TaxID=213312 RepID=UPI00223905E2|nr:helix-turn-helix transcriptional regulator [Herbaspirillum lusitanum]
MNTRQHAGKPPKSEPTESSDNLPSPLVQSFGIGVRQLREAQGWSQERLAENSNLNRSYIGEIERGCAIASLVTVEKLAVALKLTPSALVTRGEAISQMNLVRGIKLMAIAC